jgi:hypothetical protein
MLRFLSSWLLLCVCALHGQAQSLYMPRDIQRAYQKGTRSADGRPGKNYWQNTARYNITVRAMPPNRTIQGSEQITYFNNSPDTLKRIVIRLTQNIHKPGVTRNDDASESYLTTGVQIDTFAVAGKIQPFKPGPHATWQMVTLPRPLMPHDSVRHQRPGTSRLRWKAGGKA